MKFFAFSLFIIIILYGLIGQMVYSQGVKQAEAQRDYYASILNDSE